MQAWQAHHPTMQGQLAPHNDAGMAGAPHNDAGMAGAPHNDAGSVRTVSWLTFWNFTKRNGTAAPLVSAAVNCSVCTASRLSPASKSGVPAWLMNSFTLAGARPVHSRPYARDGTLVSYR